jgi:UDPglucose 6-dehydrogenase
MQVAVVALGYVGLTSAFSLASKGFEVVGYDIDQAKIRQLKKSLCPLSEPKMGLYLKKYAKRLLFTDKPEDLKGSEAYLICVDTPTQSDGTTDLTHFHQCLELIKKIAAKGQRIIIRSTVPLGTCEAVAREFEPLGLGVISHPEFLAEGHAMDDEEAPARLVVGAGRDDDFAFMRQFYKKEIASGVPYYEMDRASSELTKYASNVFLTLKISYINELARLADKTGADIKTVALAMGADPRIGHSMLGAGVGYGGGCLVKDGEALIHSGAVAGVPMTMAKSALAINEGQPAFFVSKIKEKIPDLKGRKIAVLGLAYKAGTGDFRNSTSSLVIGNLLKEGAEVVAFDKAFPAGTSYLCPVASSLETCLQGADALVVLTEEEDFKNLNENALLKLMKGRFIFDGRNLWSPQHFHYFAYISIGRPDSLPKLG